MVTFLVALSYVKYNPNILQKESMYSAGVLDVERSIAFVMIAPDLNDSDDVYVMESAVVPATMKVDSGVYPVS